MINPPSDSSENNEDDPVTHSENSTELQKPNFALQATEMAGSDMFPEQKFDLKKIQCVLNPHPS